METFAIRGRFNNKIFKDLIDRQKEEQLAKEAAEDVVVDGVVIKGATSTSGTGYSSFKDLVNAKKKKAGEVEATVRRSSGNFASLLGGDNRLG